MRAWRPPRPPFSQKADGDALGDFRRALGEERYTAFARAAGIRAKPRIRGSHHSRRRVVGLAEEIRPADDA